jgi:hypothetical protein
MLRVTTNEIATWPKLVWTASSACGSSKVTIRHGPGVETGEDWWAEAVWAGDFEAGDFDRTDMVFGSGIRDRGDRIVFVSSGSTVDRLWYCLRDRTWHFSNSLPALLAITKTSLLDCYPYYRDIETVTLGLDKVQRQIPSQEGDLRVVYFHNLIYDGESVSETEKPDTAPRFQAFDDYSEFLRCTAKKLGENMRDARREHRIEPLSTISSGYDSTTAAVVARHAGCSTAATLRTARSLVPRDDSGEEIATLLGLSCKSYDRTIDDCQLEEAFWAAAAWAQDVNLSSLEYPEPLCLLFTGFHGDKVWGREPHVDADRLARGDSTGLGLCEFRLIRGILHCPVPFWGGRQAEALRRISNSAELAPWALNNDYDRPICRRIVEEAGVPRATFGIRKSATSFPGLYPWPISHRARSAFRDYLERKQLPSSPGWLPRLLHAIDRDVLTAARERFGLSLHLDFSCLLGPVNDMLFQWGNDELRAAVEPS